MGIVIPEVLNHYNVYNDKAKKLIGISGEIELGELEALTDTLEGAGVLGEIEDAVTGQFASIKIKIPFSDIDKLDEKTLDYFAVEQRAMYYSQTLPIEQKKAIIKNTLNWYTKAGTPAAVSEMVDVVLGGGKVVEWFDFDEPPYTPGTFDIVTSALMTSDIPEN